MKILNTPSLKAYNTFGIDAQCRKLVIVEHDDEVCEVIKQHLNEGEFYILGGGSNVLFTKDFEGTIVHFQTKGIDIVAEDEEQVQLKVAAGEVWDDFVKYCVAHQYYGVENLISIPGLVGSCPVQNIGAYGTEVKDVISKVEGYYIADAKPFVFDHSQCHFGYRNSIFKNELKNKCLITNVYFTFSKKEKYNINYNALKEKLQDQSLTLQKVADTVAAIRKSKLPDVHEIGSAGSFFKNPIVTEAKLQSLLADYPNLVHYPAENGVKLAAGQLIDLCGCKGCREGNVGTYPLQALVIVNYGGAKGVDVVNFYTSIQRAVKEKFDVAIEPEVNVL